MATFKYRSNGQPGTDMILIEGIFNSILVDGSGKIVWEDRPLISGVSLQGKKVIITGFNFKGDDKVTINDKEQKVKFTSVLKLIAKKGKKALFVCTDGTPRQNTVKVFRNPVAVPQPAQDTAAFATCP